MNNMGLAIKTQVMVVGVKGSIGRFLAQGLSRSGCTVTGMDIAALDAPMEGVSFCRADMTSPTPEVQSLLKQTKVLVLALSQEVINKVLPVIQPYLDKQCLIVDTLSIKSDFLDLVSELDLPQPVLGINPMFSGDLDPTGRPVAVVVYRKGDGVDAFLATLSSWQLNVIPMAPANHDKEMALLQSLGHAAIIAFGKVLQQSGLSHSSIDALAPPPFRVLLSLLARMSQNHPDVYWEIQADNRYASSARQQLIHALEALEEQVGTGDRFVFSQNMAQLKSSLVDPNPGYVATSRQIFEYINRPQPSFTSSDAMSDFRKQIDDIDDQIVDLLGCRLGIVRQVASSKKASATPVMQPQRVIEVKQRCQERGQRHQLRPDFMQQLYQFIIDEACHIEYDLIDEMQPSSSNRNIPTGVVTE